MCTHIILHMKETMRTLQGHRAYSRTDNSDEFSLIPLPVGKAPAHASPPGGSTAPPPLTTAPLTCCGHRFPLLSRQDLSLDLLGPHPVSSLWDGILSHDPRDPVYLLCLSRDGAATVRSLAGCPGMGTFRCLINTPS